MALYPAAVKRLIPPGPNDPPIKPRVAILHVAATEASTLYDWFNGPSGGVESHFYVRYDGVVEQYRDTARQADANVDANDFAVSIETQGLAAGAWTNNQLAAIKALLVWLNKTHGIPLVKCPTWDGAGVGYHILFESRWDQRGASCPGPDRIKQFNNVLVPWMGAAQGDEFDMATIDDLKSAIAGSLGSIAEAVWKCGIYNPLLADKDNPQGKPVQALKFVQSINTNAYYARIDASVARSLAEAQAKVGRPLTADEIKAASEAGAKAGAAAAIDDKVAGATVVFGMKE